MSSGGGLRGGLESSRKNKESIGLPIEPHPESCREFGADNGVERASAEVRVEKEGVVTELATIVVHNQLNVVRGFVGF